MPVSEEPVSKDTVSEETCKLFAYVEKATADIILAREKIFNTVAKIVNFKADVKYGIDVLDTVVADLLTGIYSAASQVAKVTMGSISGMVTDLFELIYGALLEIFLIAPSNIFGLISIPQEAAIDATSKERMYINKAYGNLTRILSFFNKWKGKSGVDYYNQMNDALPYLEKAISLAGKLITDLEVDLDDENSNSKFNENFFKLLKSNLDAAIEITTPASTISRESEISSRLEEDKNKRYEEKSTAILVDHRIKLNNLNSEYREDTQKLISEDNYKSVVKLDLIRAVHGQKLKALNLWKKEKLAVAEVTSEAEALASKDLWIKAGRDLKDEFFSDSTELGKNLGNFYKNVSRAFLAYKESRIYCNNIYDMRAIISSLIKEIIAFMRSSSNEESQKLIPKLEKVQSLIEFTDFEFKAAIGRYLESSQQISSTSMATTVATGHGALITADAMLNVSITQSLIDLLNLDDLLDNKSGEFDEFIERLKNIQDWDGKTGVWSVDLGAGSPSPYIQLLADASTMLTKVAVLSARNNDEDFGTIINLTKETFRNFKIIRSHNSEVTHVLSSYTPYSGTKILDLKRILDKSGLTDSFAKGMSLLTIATDLSSYVKGFFDGNNVNYNNCKSEYSDLFSDDKLAVAAQMRASNLGETKVTSRKNQLNVERKVVDIARMKKMSSTEEGPSPIEENNTRSYDEEYDTLSE